MTDIGYSSLTERVYIGNINPKKPGVWSGEKRDITSRFIEVALQYFEPGFARTISGGGKKFRITVKEITP